MSRSNSHSDESFEEYTPEEIELLDKWQSRTNNKFDDSDLYDAFVRANFKEEEIEAQINEMLKDLQKGNEYSWQVVEKKKPKKTQNKQKDNKHQSGYRKENSQKDSKDNNITDNNYHKNSNYRHNNRKNYRDSYYNNNYYRYNRNQYNNRRRNKQGYDNSYQRQELVEIPSENVEVEVTGDFGKDREEIAQEVAQAIENNEIPQDLLEKVDSLKITQAIEEPQGIEIIQTTIEGRPQIEPKVETKRIIQRPHVEEPKQVEHHDEHHEEQKEEKHHKKSKHEKHNKHHEKQEEETKKPPVYEVYQSTTFDIMSSAPKQEAPKIEPSQQPGQQFIPKQMSMGVPSMGAMPTMPNFPQQGFPYYYNQMYPPYFMVMPTQPQQEGQEPGQQPQFYPYIIPYPYQRMSPADIQKFTQAPK